MEPENNELSDQDRYLIEAAARALREAARIIGSWRDYKDSAQTFLAVQDRLVKRLAQEDE